MNRALNIRILFFLFSLASIVFLVSRIQVYWFEIVSSVLLTSLFLFFLFRSTKFSAGLNWFLLVWGPSAVALTMWLVFFFTPSQWESHPIDWDRSRFMEQSGVILMEFEDHWANESEWIRTHSPEDIGDRWQYAHFKIGVGPLDRVVIKKIEFNNQPDHP